MATRIRHRCLVVKANLPLRAHENLTVPHPTLSSNLKALMEAHATLRTQAAVGKAAGIDQRTVGRILNGSHNPTLKHIEALAKCFKLTSWQLLMPGLDPKNLPVAQTAAERALYDRLRNAVAELPKA